MRSLCAVLGASVLLGMASCLGPDFERALPTGWPALLPFDPNQEAPSLTDSYRSRESLLEACANSIAWLERPASRRHFPKAGVSYDRALASCVRMEQLLLESPSAGAFQIAVEDEFEFLKSAGWDGRGGGVLFTAYYTPVFEGSEWPVGRFQYPLYSKPDDLVTDRDGRVLGQRGSEGFPYPSRRTIEKYESLAGEGLELIWLKDPLDAYLCHVQGSAFVRLVDGTEMRFGFGGTNGRDYTSLAKELEADGKLPRGLRGVPAIRKWADENPDEVEEYLHRNDRYTFFTRIDGTPHGSLDVPVTARASLATDKTVFPRAVPVFASCELGADTQNLGAVGRRGRGLGEPFDQLLFDQDTGGGIRTAGRADVYLGVGERAGDLAGRTASDGQLFYVVLRKDRVADVLANRLAP